jgi:hypothetical protein
LIACPGEQLGEDVPQLVVVFDAEDVMPQGISETAELGSGRRSDIL